MKRVALPKYFDKFTYSRKQREAQQALKKNYQAALTEYLKAKRDAEAQALEEEYSQILNPRPKEPLPRSAESQPSLPEKPDRWINTLYGTTIYRVRGKQWTEVENKTGKAKWSLEERERTPDYVVLYNPARRQVWRIYEKRIAMEDSNGGWKDIAYGYWEKAD